MTYTISEPLLLFMAGIALYTYVTLFVPLHESGHYLASRLLGLQVTDSKFIGESGWITTFFPKGTPQWRAFVVTLGGPLITLLPFPLVYCTPYTLFPPLLFIRTTILVTSVLFFTKGVHDLLPINPDPAADCHKIWRFLRTGVTIPESPPAPVPES